MPFELNLPRRLRQQGWKVKIQDKERLEPPHVTVWLRAKKWRIGLRDKGFLDDEPNPDDVPKNVREVLADNWERLCDEWDARYPSNPVESADENDE